MNIEILTDENGQLYDVGENKFTFYELHNEFGSYQQLKGIINFNAPEKSVSIQTRTLNSDVFGLLYSINDYLEFGFVSTMLDDEKTTFAYEGYNSTEIKLTVDEMSMLVVEDEFLLALINSSSVLFKSLWIDTGEEKYQMYVDTAESLRQKTLQKN